MIISRAYSGILMSFCMHTSSFLAFQCISLSTLLNLNFYPRWLRITKYNPTFLLLRPLWVFHVNFVQFEDGRISYELAPKIRVQSARSWTNSKRFQIVMTQSKGNKRSYHALILGFGCPFACTIRASKHSNAFSLSTWLNLNFYPRWLRITK